MAAPNYTALAPPPQLQPPLAVANFKNERAISRATAKTRINMRPPNSIHMRGFSTTSDQIPNKDSPVAPSAGNPCHDLFYKVVKPYKYQYRTKKNPEAEAEVDASCAYLKQPLPLAWSHDPLTTLKLIANLLHGRFFWEAFYTSVYWLHHNHPKTLLCYATFAKSTGKLYGLPEIPYRLLEDRDRRRGRENKSLAMAKKAIERYKRDPDYKLLYDQVTDVYAECLKSDLENLKKQNLKREYHGGYFDDSDDDEDDGNCEKISDAANSCRSDRPNSAVPIRTTFLRENIARKVFPEGNISRIPRC
ncbi:hypothetical protein ACFX15_038180 [Malus domestica]